jgi:hypothetical protein
LKAPSHEGKSIAKLLQIIEGIEKAKANAGQTTTFDRV